MSDVFLPTPWTVGHKAYQGEQYNDWGDLIETWADPVELPVYGIAPGGSESNAEPDPSRPFVSTTKQLLMPLESAQGLTPQDKFILDGVEWEQNGDVLDYTKGPFGWSPGVVVNIKRVTG